MYKFEDLIEEVKEFNTDLRYGLDDIVGVTIEKGLIPTIANLTQTALDKFYIIKPETFVYNPRTHGVRLGMGYNDTCNTYITTWNNVAFRVKDTAKNIVIPQYLWLYFCRPIWDRLTNFLAWRSSTIVFAWKDFLTIEIDLPSITRQREIVAEYETLTRRIRINEQMIQNLESTAQTLYRKMFVDGIDKENLPEGWRMGTLGEVANCLDYKRRPLSEEQRKTLKGDYPYYGAMSLVDHINQYIFDGTYLLFSEDGVNVIDEFGHPALQYLWGKFWVNNHAHVLQGNDIISTEYLYMALKNVNVRHLVTGAAQPKINQENMNSIQLLIPSKNEMEKYNINASIIFRYYKIAVEENLKLTELQSLLLAKMGQ